MNWIEKTGLCILFIVFQLNEEVITAEIIILMTAGLICFFFGDVVAEWLKAKEEECSES